MSHSTRHRELMIGLALGILTDHELNEAAALLEECAACERLLARYHGELSPEASGGALQDASSGVPRKVLQFPIILEGPEEVVDRALERLQALAAGEASVRVVHCLLAAAATGAVKEVASVVGVGKDAIVKVARVFLQGRESGEALAVGFDAYLVRDQDTGVVRAVTRTASAGSSPDDLERLVIESDL